MPNPSLVSNRFQLAEFKRHIFRARPEVNTKPEALLDPVYWAHVGANLNLYDKIEAVAEDGAWFAELIVTGKSPQGVSVRFTNFVDLTAEAEVPEAEDADDLAAIVYKKNDPVPPAGFAYKWQGVKGKFTIYRLSDKAVIAEGIQSKADLIAELAKVAKAAA